MRGKRAYEVIGFGIFRSSFFLKLIIVVCNPYPVCMPWVKSPMPVHKPKAGATAGAGQKHNIPTGHLHFGSAK
jgi:hypothetical protein